MNRLRKDVLHTIFRESAYLTFGKYTSTTIKKIIYDAFPEKISFRYQIPPALCCQINEKPHPSSPNEKDKPSETPPQLTAGGLLAIFDELSTYPILLEDRKYRAGVSVDLFSELLQPVYANEEVFLVTRTDKIGKILAFCSMELQNLDGKVIARGKHIKYLPIGLYLELIAQSPLLPLLNWLYYKFRVGMFESPLDKVFGLSEKEVPIPSEVLTPGHVFKQLLPIKIHDNATDRQAILIDAPDNHHCPDAELYYLRVSREVKQFIGNFHGGAVGASVDLCSRLFKFSRQPALEGEIFVKSVDIRYINPMRGELLIKVGDDLYAEKIALPKDPTIKTSSKSVGYIYSQKNHNICAEFTCEWTLVVPS